MGLVKWSGTKLFLILLTYIGGLSDHADPIRPAQRPSLGRVVSVLFVILAAKSLFGIGHSQRFAANDRQEAAARAAAARIWPVAFVASPAFSAIHLGGRLVDGAGEPIDLGDTAVTPAGALGAWLLGPRKMILPSCLTAPPPAAPPPSAPPPASPPPGAEAAASLPVRDDLPGFYGAPWTATVAGNLVVLLHVSAPRDAALPVPETEVQIYRAYDGRALAPDFGVPAPVKIYRGSAAVLYRVFAGAPLRCLDLVVPAGQPAGTGNLYYQLYRHYFEVTARFVIQK